MRLQELIIQEEESANGIVTATIIGEIIRCKDCVFNHDGECWGFGDGHLVHDDDYCSGGERKEE